MVNEISTTGTGHRSVSVSLSAQQEGEKPLALPLHGYSDSIILTMAAALFFQKAFFYIPHDFLSAGLGLGGISTRQCALSVDGRQSQRRRQLWYASLYNRNNLLMIVLDQLGLLQLVLCMGILDLEMLPDGDSSSPSSSSSSQASPQTQAPVRRSQAALTSASANPLAYATWALEYQANWL